jgi:hypothetical protein
MAANDKQFDSRKPYQRQDVLRAKDVIPGPRRSEIENIGGSAIPQFDLAQDIMAEHRRLTATRRRSPSPTIERAPVIENRESSVELRVPSIPDLSEQWDPIIADIVTRDIEGFCGGRL